VPFSVNGAADDAREIQPDLTVLPLCALDGTGVDAWCDYLEAERRKLLA
jgi:hydrogenase nickel incorporation protein HypB